MAQIKKVKIGDLLLEAGLINDEQLKEALKYQKDQGGKLGDIIIQLKFVEELQLLKVLSDQLKIPFIDLEHFNIKADIIRKIPERIARRFRILSLDFIGDQYLVVMADPTDVLAYDEINHILDAPIRTAIAKESSILKIIDKVYRRTADISSFAEELKEELTTEVAEITQEDLQKDTAPVAKLLGSVFEDAVQIGASDVHLEPDDVGLRIRQRVDGILQEQVIPSKEIIPAVALRVKLMAKLNISEKRLPQDGRFKIKVKNRNIDVRVSTMPVRFGESVVMRLLDQSHGILDIRDIGMDNTVFARVLYHIKRPTGMILVTGPTGSGKTTTLYAALNELNNEHKKIITIEDPVEYTLPRVNQVQVNSAIELTFARVLRAALRQDPDIVMIGEIRDEETASIGLRAAMTGHLVLSTLHTNDAISSVIRLIDMGAEGYLVASAVRLVLAQRLVRRICSSCKHKVELINDEQKSILTKLLGSFQTSTALYVGLGCTSCNGTGYAGRIAVHEMLEIDSELSAAIRDENTSMFSELAIKSKNFKPLVISALDLALSGITTLDEVVRIAAEIEDVRTKNTQ